MPVSAQNQTVVRNLLTAFEGESNAHAKYAAFAAKADAEGFHGIASLFRATSRAEQIHAGNHAKVIERLEGEARCQIHPAKVGGTLDNLADALAGETYEIQTMYPDFMAAAMQPAATRTFRFALEAEKTHAHLYTEAIAALKAGEAWIRTARDFVVCPTCGYTTKSIGEQESCPVCGAQGTRFETIR
jgi:rubrerythrin